MQVDPQWLLPTDDPRVRRNRAEVLAFTTLAEAAPAPEPAPTKLTEATAPARPAGRRPPVVDPARVQALLDAAPAPGAGPRQGDPAGTRRALLDLYAELDQMAEHLARGSPGS